jgi:hypothetical protein
MFLARKTNRGCQFYPKTSSEKIWNVCCNYVQLWGGEASRIEQLVNKEFEKNQAKKYAPAAKQSEIVSERHGQARGTPSYFSQAGFSPDTMQCARAGGLGRSPDPTFQLCCVDVGSF